VRSDSTFWRAVAETTTAALASGALQPISTTSRVIRVIEDGGVRFLTRVVENLERKRVDAIRKPDGFDPFAEPEKELFVADVSDTHLAVLNKFNVVDQHVLLVTRAFEEQESLLTLEDFEAALFCLADADALVFYNAGPNAGASQRHKHLQVVPVPLGDGSERTPIEAVLDDDSRGLPFSHAFCRLDKGDDASKHHEKYSRLLASLGNPRAYNLLATRDWMLVVPRACGSWNSIPVNAIGFAGALLVRSEEQWSQLERLGPMRLLREVTLNV
jgi:ATP adenylyltransferase